MRDEWSVGDARMRATSSGVTNDSVPGPARPYHGAWSKKDYRLVAAVDYDYREDQLENIAAQVNRLAPQIQDDARAVQHTVRTAAALGQSGSRVRHHQKAIARQQGASSPRQRPVRSSVIASSFKTFSLDNGTEFPDYAVLERRFP